MSPTGWLALVAVAVLAAVATSFLLGRRRRGGVRSRGGPRRGASMHGAGRADGAGGVSEEREQKVTAFRPRRLNRDEAARYRQAWRRVQVRFTDQPQDAMLDADRLIADVMHTCGYPTADFDGSAARLSADHAKAVVDYRTAHEMLERREGGTTAPDDLRLAMARYRALFADLVGLEDSGAFRKRA